VLSNDSVTSSVSNRLQAAIYRESLALVDAGVADACDIDLVITSAIGRRWAVAGPFEIWEQIGWDLVQIIAGELYKEISNSNTPTDLPNYKPIDRLESSAEPSGSASTRFEKIAVVGAGLMGHGIALEFASRGRQVVLHDISEALLDDAIVRARTGLQALASVDRISEGDVESALARISTTTDLGEAVSNADLVVEASSENLELKQQIFSAIDRAALDHAILASNSSTFVPSAYGAATQRASRVIGVHYYNPPHLLPGVEVVKGSETSDEVVELVTREYELIGKKPAIVQREVQGFIGNRLQVALLREAMSIVEEGLATALQVDEIVRQGFGRESSQVGIFEKIASATAASEQMASKETFSQLNSDRELPRVLLEKIESNDLGVKVGRGFYEWTPESAEKWRKNMADSLLHMG